MGYKREEEMIAPAIIINTSQHSLYTPLRQFLSPLTQEY
jgi:hypothetical protein